MATKKPPVSPESVVWKSESVETQQVSVFNIATGRQEMKLTMGNITERDADGKPVEVTVNSEVRLNPFAAKRLARLLNDTVGRYEETYGELKFKSQEK